MTKISLITTCYNSEKTISDTLKSINNQDYEDIEHIVIDGNSSDSTIEIIKREGTRVSRLVSEKDEGSYDAYNKGLALANGEVIGFLNSDDFYTSNSVISKVMEIFQDPEIEACHADLYYVDFDDTNKVRRHWRSNSFSDQAYKRGQIPAHPTVFIRKSVYERIGNFNTSFSLVADYDLLLRVFYVEKVKSKYVDDVWIRMRVGGATGAGFLGILKQNIELQRARKENGINVPFLQIIFHKVIKYIREHLNTLFIK